MLITEQDIRDTLSSYADDEAESYDALFSTMHEVYDHLTKAAAALDAGLLQTRTPINASPFADLAIAQSHLNFALSAWDPG